MKNENYKLYRKHRTEMFDMFYDAFEKAPIPPTIGFFFGMGTNEEKEEFNKQMDEYLEIEKPKIIERFKEMGFEIK